MTGASEPPTRGGKIDFHPVEEGSAKAKAFWERRVNRPRSQSVLSEGPPLVPGSSKSFPGTQGLPEIFRSTRTDRSGPELT